MRRTAAKLNTHDRGPNQAGRNTCFQSDTNDIIKGIESFLYFRNIEGDSTRGDPEDGTTMPQLDDLASEYIRRVNLAAEKKEYKVHSGLVKYYDPDIGTPSVHYPIQTLFLKRRMYECQKECHLAIDTGTTTDCPINFDVGGIEDIAVQISTPDLISFKSFEIART